MGLSAVLAELDGTGVPLCYLFHGSNGSDTTLSPAIPGSSTLILEQFLRPLKVAGFNPSFFGCDKDRAEISAIQRVWPNVRVQICFWHAKRAVRMKLQSSVRTSNLKYYQPQKAQMLVPTIEICWGSLPTCRPNGDHRYGRCQCASSSAEIQEHGRLETVSVVERNIFL